MWFIPVLIRHPPGHPTGEELNIVITRLSGKTRFKIVKHLYVYLIRL